MFYRLGGLEKCLFKSLPKNDLKKHIPNGELQQGNKFPRVFWNDDPLD